jgi:4-hydroxybenzoate polyprenyltransferase
LVDWVKALRLKHWTKTFFVVAPFLIGPRFGFNSYLLRALFGAIVFGLFSSAVYLFNDIKDAPYDRVHPTKRQRPIAAGRISVGAAASVGVVLFIVSLGLAYVLDIRFLLILLVYGANNVAYSLYLKEKTVIDILSIATGFVLRVLAGGYLVDIVVTNWLLASVFTLAVMMGFGKRRGEYEELRDGARSVRAVHESYSIPKLDLLLGISASITIVTYMLYSMAPETIAIHGTDKLIITTPFVVYCIYRYTLKVQELRGGDPVELILKDRGFTLAGLSWLGLLLFLTK